MLYITRKYIFTCGSFFRQKIYFRNFKNTFKL